MSSQDTVEVFKGLAPVCLSEAFFSSHLSLFPFHSRHHFVRIFTSAR